MQSPNLHLLATSEEQLRASREHFDRIDRVQRRFAAALKHGAGAVVEVTMNPAGADWCVSGDPDQVETACQWLAERGLAKVARSEFDEELGERFSFLVDQ